MRTANTVGRVLLGPKTWNRLTRHPNLTAVLMLALVALFWGLSGLTVVGPDQTGLVKRWGRLTGDQLGPGLHWLAPEPIESLTLVEPYRVHYLEVGFRTRTDAPAEAVELRTNYEWDSLHQSGLIERRVEEALTLTGDENLLEISLVVEYVLSDPTRTLYLSDEARVVRYVIESNLHSLVAEQALQGVLIHHRREIEREIGRRAQADLDAIAVWRSNRGPVRAGALLQAARPLPVGPSLRRQTDDYGRPAGRGVDRGRDPELYQLLRTLSSYRKFLDEQTILVLDSNAEPLKLLVNGVVRRGAEVP